MPGKTKPRDHFSPPTIGEGGKVSFGIKNIDDALRGRSNRCGSQPHRLWGTATHQPAQAERSRVRGYQTTNPSQVECRFISKRRPAQQHSNFRTGKNVAKEMSLYYLQVCRLTKVPISSKVASQNNQKKPQIILTVRGKSADNLG